MENNNPLEYNSELQQQLELFLVIGRDKGGNKYPTTKQIKVASAIVVGKSPTQALREAGYSKSAIDKPSIITKGKGVVIALERFTEGKDIELAESVLDILHNARKSETLTFPSYPKQTENETLEEYQERIKGIITNDEIKKLLEEVGGNWVNISLNTKQDRVVSYYFPDYRAQLKALEMIFKIKGSYAPIQNKNKNMGSSYSPSMLREDIEKREKEVIL